MIEEQGKVIDVRDDMALIEIQRKSVCQSCSLNKGCGTGVISSMIGNKRFRFSVYNSLNAEIGDNVTIGIEDDLLLKSSFAVYITPLLLMFVGAWSGIYIASLFSLASSEGLSVIFGILGLTVGFVWLNRYTKKIKNDDRYRPVLLGCRPDVGVVVPPNSF
jgi:sigma-E factor negative regulatory protein RseC